MTIKKTKNTSISLENNKKKLVQLLWISLLLVFLLAGLVFFYISKALLPDTEELENPRYEIASVILADDNSELGKVFKLNREWVSFEEINPFIINALIATEDERFFSHSGIDVKSTIRAFIFLGKKGGASTITQQLSKQFFTQRSSSFIKRLWQKLKEWVIAVEFEKRYTKEEILAMYLNKFDFIHGANGIAAAAKTYFGKDQSILNTSEAAVLIGMLKNPVLYNPVDNPENAFKRRGVVLRQMLRNKFITKDEYKKFVETPLDMGKFSREIYYDGIAPYFRAEVVKTVKQILDEDKYRKPDGTKYNIYTDGLRIYTTIDKKMQIYAEQAVADHMAKVQKRYFDVWKDKDPWTYGASGEAKKVRFANLAEQMRQSDRFKRLRAKFLTKISGEIYREFPESRLWDSDIFRLFSIEGDSKVASDLIKKNIISEKQGEVYMQILKSKYWPELKSNWEKLRIAADKEFSTPINMIVYDYETGKEKRVTMSPLDSIKYHQKHLQIGTIGVDPKTGYVKMWVGGINHKYFQYDHVRSTRQVGSTFKPFVYATAIIDLAFSPCMKVQDIQYCIPANDPNFKLSQTWCPSNADGKFSGEWMTLKDALKESKNSVSVYLMKEIGNVESVRNLLSTLNVDISKVPSQPSICLGSAELSAFQMATAYTAFANNGLQSNPIFITKIEDKNGRVIYTAASEQKRAINENYNYVIVNMLQSAASAISSKFKSQVAGKTGTTNDYKDGWFIGFTPEIVVATWVGGDVEWVRFTSLSDGQGSRMARPFFESFLQKLESDPTVNYNANSRFAVPSGELIVTDCGEYDKITQKSSSSGDDFDEEFLDEL